MSLRATRLAGFPIQFCEVLLVCLKFLTVVTAIWTAYRIVDMMANYMAKRAAKTESKFDDLIVPLVSKIVKIIITLVGVIVFVDVFGDDWKAILGGLGIGGAAIAFASKDSIGNFFGSVTVLCDRPFEIGTQGGGLITSRRSRSLLPIASQGVVGGEYYGHGTSNSPTW